MPVREPVERGCAGTGVAIELLGGTPPKFAQMERIPRSLFTAIRISAFWVKQTFAESRQRGPVGIAES